MANGYKQSNREIELFITHRHWDHLQGLPFFIPAHSSENNINVY